jgi:hypothetical protein
MAYSALRAAQIGGRERRFARSCRDETTETVGFPRHERAVVRPQGEQNGSSARWFWAVWFPEAGGPLKG